ncbi:MAG TPA: hypothetical protein VGS19_30975 [Streptosporangiaceae bacterium]|nr:hypothetical protein [Streptosporangiaceae bacterium]
MRRIRFFTTYAALAVSAALVLTGCPGPSPVGPSIGSILQSLAGSVDSIIATATTGAESDILTASGSVQSAIDTAASAYAQDLNLTINQVNATVSSSIAQLQNLVAELQTSVATTLQTATNDAQQLINSIPFTNKNPQVTSYSPHFVQQGTQASIEVIVNGNFVYAAQQHLTPTLSVGGRTIRPNENTTPQLGFSVPMSLLPSAGAALQSISLRLSAPYEQGLVFHSTQLDSFALLVTVLPANPFTSLVLYTNQQGGEVQKTIVQPPGSSASSGGWYLESYSTCQDASFTDAFGADPNWTIIPSTVTAVVTSNKNPGNAQVTAVGSIAQAQINAMTEPNCTCFIVCGSHGSGDVTFYLTYTEEQAGPSTVQATPISLGWGDTVSESVSSGWTLKATLFDGHLIDFNNSDSSNPYIHVTNYGANITISTQYTDLVY